MKRKVFSNGQIALGITLPSKWHKKVGIKKGDILNVELKDKKMIVSPDNIRSEIKKISVSVKNLNSRVIRWTLGAYYKKGYDEIKIYFSKQSEFKAVENEMKNLFIGFIISEQSKDSVVIKSVAKEDTTQFDSLLRRAFLVTLMQADGMIKLIEKNEYSELNNLSSLELTNNQLTTCCQRILNKGIHDEKKTFYYVICHNLEQVSDHLKYIAQNVSLNKELSVLLQLKNTILFFRKYYELFYNYNSNEMNKIVKNKEELMNTLLDAIKKKSNNQEVLFHLLSMVSTINNFSTSMIAINS